MQRFPHNYWGLWRKALAVIVAACGFAQLAHANPVGPTVVNGSASFSTQGNLFTVTNTPGAILNWQSFSIAQGEITRFVQQSPLSAVLNRVIGIDPSSILGVLQSNGRVFLINPNG
ncbi:MAG TPA: filamentous hemagglutinin N-terminal domain-containing protein, partial [Burkholderiales bacterium]|nr:filamentous hemagglutinin N-terminal domain-containing protein [Burkholderiales bacterium]